MEYRNLELTPESRDRRLPSLQTILLLGILLGYPVLSVVMSFLRGDDQTVVVSRIEQIYLPALFVQSLMIFLIILVLRRTGSRFAEIGLGRQDVSWSNALSGVIFFVGAWVIILVLKGAIERSGYVPEKDFVYLLPQSIAEKTFWLILSAGAAISEELTFRGYVISRLRILSGQYWPGVILSSLAFSLGHIYQGLAGVILTFTYGLLFAGLFVARGNIFPCIVAHFLQDALVLIAFRA